MKVVRRETFETNSSSTHSFAISRGSDNWERLNRIFNTILFGDTLHGIYGIDDIYDEEGLVELLKLLTEAQQILLDGTEDYH